MDGARWGRVVSAFDHRCDSHVLISDEFGREKSVERSRCYPRVVKSVAHITVSDDKDHDTWFVQEAMRRQFSWLQGQTKFEGLDQINEHLVRSDGATSKTNIPFIILACTKKRVAFAESAGISELQATARDLGTGLRGF